MRLQQNMLRAWGQTWLTRPTHLELPASRLTNELLGTRRPDSSALVSFLCNQET